MADLSTLALPRDLSYDLRTAAPRPSWSPPSCDVCGDLEHVIPFAVELPAIVKSSRRGCVPCKILFAALEPHTRSCFRPQELRRLILIRWNVNNLILQVPDLYSIYPSKKRFRGIYLKLHVCLADGAPFQRSLLPKFLLKSGVEDYGTAEHRIREWLTGCEQSHVACRAAEKDALTKLPTRVLEILGPRLVRIFVPRSRNEEGRYACLSHCWGPSVPLQTTSATIYQFQQHISWDKIPATFQHAIDMTHRLGLRYLWIDSLCILQDDVDDWRHEGGQMAEIYSKAYVTLAATSASNSADGFYHTRSGSKPREHRTVKMRDSEHSGGSFDVLIWQRFPTPNKNFVIGDLPLLKRAWAYQERLLSPRTVHFADDMLYWECSSLTTSEVSGRRTGLESAEVIHTLKALLSSGVPEQRSVATTASNGTHLSFAPEPRLRIMWYNIVRRFTLCSLSYPSDIFPALQGVARRMQLLRHSAYYAGLWKDTLCSDLLWVARTYTPLLPPDYKYRAPSWSWASIAGPVAWPYSHNSLKKEIHIISVDTTPAGDDPLGELTTGTLRLRGRSLPGTLRRFSHDVTALFMEYRTGQLNFEWHQDCQLPYRFEQIVTVVVIGSWLKDSFYLVLAETDARRHEYRRLGIARHEVNDMRSTMVKVLDGHMNCEAYRPYEQWESCRHLEDFTIF